MRRLGSPSRNWLSKRLKQLADARGTVLPDSFEHYLSSLSRFSEEALENACRQIEQEPVSDYQSRFPELGKIMSYCRSYWKMRQGEQGSWTLNDFKMSIWVDEYLRDFPEKGPEVREHNPSFYRLWLRYRNDLKKGTAICAAWCDNCKGTGWLETTLGKESAVKPCSCRISTAGDMQ